MKNTPKIILSFTLVTLLVLVSAGKSLAHYEHDDKGWFDEHHKHHEFVTHNGHRGYWDKDDHGAKIFIKI